LADVALTGRLQKHSFFGFFTSEFEHGGSDKDGSFASTSDPGSISCVDVFGSNFFSVKLLCSFFALRQFFLSGTGKLPRCDQQGKPLLLGNVKNLVRV